MKQIDKLSFECTEAEIFGDRWAELITWIFDRNARHRIKRSQGQVEMTFEQPVHAMEFKLKFFS